MDFLKIFTQSILDHNAYFGCHFCHGLFRYAGFCWFIHLIGHLSMSMLAFILKSTVLPCNHTSDSVHICYLDSYDHVHQCRRDVSGLDFILIPSKC